MSPAPPAPPQRAPGGHTDFIRRRAPTLWVIIAIKLGKALLCLLLAAGFFSLVGRDVGALFDDLLRWARLNPAQKLFAWLGHQLDLPCPLILFAAAAPGIRLRPL
jgi:hypothetical protein